MTALFDGVRVVPVVVLHDEAHAAPLARSLAGGGLSLIEVTLRTPQALASIARIRTECPDVVCGVGTVLTPQDVQAAVDAGAQFLVSPGTTEPLLDAMLATGLPVLPGAATASEAMRLLSRGVSLAKFFPAEASGGVAALSALSGPLPGLRFCATGGIGPANAGDYLALPNVACIGGSWMVPKAAVSAGDWDAITLLAKEAAQL